MGISLSYPLVNEPESYVDPDFDEDSDAFDFGKQLHEINLFYCYEMIEHRIRSIKEETRFLKYAYTWPDVAQELKIKYPDWTKDDLLHLKHQFEFFDTTGDRLLSFEEFSAALDLMNNPDSEEVRRDLFDTASVQKYNTLNFDEYLKLMYDIKNSVTLVTPPQIEESHEKNIEQTVSDIAQMDPFSQMCFGVF
ncbi:uncharacterized protein si:ch211-122l24.6 [Clupea harengus]|uniref:Uncharacterized protein si:ch211-122l24.6 n=1 Tax=Clupea harengus TaxID=7950 RepID=A0A8M1KUS1_CLUHA|nr:uncharacterized protein si:ch211-122l24.6 [Clupea harengus]XP_042566414.1 uncharacterized protein si:ch211-122l24.6 [Clupea harengus]XP_042566415.1 uncharacterized protein si:ch211-122l24.6 [Clupea harengus]